MNFSIHNYNVLGNHRNSIGFGMSPQNIRKAEQLEQNLNSRKDEFRGNADEIRNNVMQQLDYANKQDLMFKSTETYEGQVYQQEESNGEINLLKHYDISGNLVWEKLSSNNDDSVNLLEKHSASSVYEHSDNDSNKVAEFSDSDELQRVSIEEPNGITQKRTSKLVNSALQDAMREIEENNISPKTTYCQLDILYGPAKISDEYKLSDGDIFKIEYSIDAKATRKTLKTKDGIIMTQDKDNCCSIYFDRKDSDFIGVNTDKNNNFKNLRTDIIFQKPYIL